MYKETYEICECCAHSEDLPMNDDKLYCHKKLTDVELYSTCGDYKDYEEGVIEE